MAEAAQSPQLIHFGVFELDLRAGELRKKGVRVKLQEQPFQILVMLLEHPGQVVTREELHQKLWPEGTFVDFEHGLNAAVNRLRDALEDSPENSRFVETLPRRGYRFIAPVEGLSVSPPPRTLRASWARPAWGVGLTLMALAVLVGLNVGGLRNRLQGGPAPGKITSLAVLPLENLSGDPEQDYFADGMTEALIMELGKISALRVISRQSVMQYKGTDKPLPDIAEELKVDAIVEGSALREGDRVRISAQLIRAVPEKHLWAQSYERNLTNVLALQREVTRAIAREIKVAVTPEEEIRLAGARPVKGEAYEAYLRGRYFWNKRTEEALKKSIEYFQQAIEKNPSYAPAYAGLADAYIVMIGWRFISNTEGLPHARTAATKALEIDDTLVEAHASLAGVKEQEWDWIEAEIEFRRAIELNPGYATAHQWYAEFLAKMGRFTEAVAEIKRARDLDPFSLIINAIEAQVFFLARRYDEAIKSCRRTLELDPNFFPAHLYLARAYLEMGFYEDAIAEMERWAALSGRPEMKITLAFTYAAAGQRTEVRRVLDELERFYVPPYLLALVYAGLGEKDRAFQQLDEAYDVRDPDLVYLKVDPRLDPLRSDPRFQSLLRRMNFPE